MRRKRILGLSDEESAAVFAVAKGSALLRRAAARNLSAHGNLNRAQFEVLEHLSGDPDGLRMYELADLLVLSRGTLTYHVTELEKLGLVVREGGTPEKRAVNVQITEAGRSLLEEVRDSYAHLVRKHLIECFTPEQLAVVTEGFMRIAETFDDDPSLDSGVEEPA